MSGMPCIGKRLLRTRKRHGHSRAFVAKYVGCSETTIRNRERGGGHPGEQQGGGFGWLAAGIDRYLEEFEKVSCTHPGWYFDSGGPNEGQLLHVECTDCDATGTMPIGPITWHEECSVIDAVINSIKDAVSDDPHNDWRDSLRDAADALATLQE